MYTTYGYLASVYKKLMLRCVEVGITVDINDYLQDRTGYLSAIDTLTSPLLSKGVYILPYGDYNFNKVTHNYIAINLQSVNPVNLHSIQPDQNHYYADIRVSIVVIAKDSKDGTTLVNIVSSVFNNFKHIRYYNAETKSYDVNDNYYILITDFNINALTPPEQETYRLYECSFTLKQVVIDYISTEDFAYSTLLNLHTILSTLLYNPFAPITTSNVVFEDDTVVSRGIGDYVPLSNDVEDAFNLTLLSQLTTDVEILKRRLTNNETKSIITDNEITRLNTLTIELESNMRNFVTEVRNQNVKIQFIQVEKSETWLISHNFGLNIQIEKLICNSFDLLHSKMVVDVKYDPNLITIRLLIPLQGTAYLKSFI